MGSMGSMGLFDEDASGGVLSGENRLSVIAQPIKKRRARFSTSLATARRGACFPHAIKKPASAGFVFTVHA
ncbi:hypothetical protein SOASR014_00700 [Pectobacterium carotovorum subsp. carotovorum]|nr:hypothetical protein SOASR014_00700 [Pectobacterium carotovorum subsp. carotovorum]GLX42651.1 hypothetical protein Pcaca01_03190 [Pectobacterium carotovorum subsp. carotovorum]